MSPSPFDFIEEAKKLVRFNTVTSLSNAECAVYVGSLMRRLGMEPYYQEVRADGVLFLNVMGWLGSGKAPVLWTTHLDTVSAGDPKLWKKTGGDPWKLTQKGQMLYGLGAADTKLDLLCKLSAIGRVKRAKLKKPLLVLGTFGEESGLRGAVRFCQGDVPKPAMALVGEPTDLSIVNRHKGLAILEITFKSQGLYRPDSPQWGYELLFEGEASHSSTPDLGSNALEKAMEFLRQCGKRFEKVTVLSWEGGEGHNIIPATSRLKISLGDRAKDPWVLKTKTKTKVSVQRIPPGWYPTLPWKDLCGCMETTRSVLAPLQKEQDKEFHPPVLTWNVTQLKEAPEGWVVVMDVRALPGQSTKTAFKNLEKIWWEKLGPPGKSWQWRLERDNPPLEMEKTSPLFHSARAALKAAHLPVKAAAKAGCSEAGLYSKVGIPALVFGPGQSAGNIHRPNESVPVRQLKQAIRFYEELFQRTCF